MPYRTTTRKKNTPKCDKQKINNFCSVGYLRGRRAREKEMCIMISYQTQTINAFNARFSRRIFTSAAPSKRMPEIVVHFSIVLFILLLLIHLNIFTILQISTRRIRRSCCAATATRQSVSAFY